MKYLKCNLFTLSMAVLILAMVRCTPTHKEASNATKRIPVDVTVEAHEDFGAAVHNLRYLPLETTDSNSIGWISSIVLHKDRIYLRESRRVQGIMVFDAKTGQFLYEKTLEGKGPDEVVLLADFKIHENEIYVLDNFGKKINVYAMDLQFKRTYPLEEGYALFERLGNHWWMDRAGANGYTDTVYQLRIMDEEFKVTDEFHPKIGTTTTSRYSQSKSLYRNQLLYWEMMKDTVWSYDYENGHFWTKYVVDFGEQKIPSAWWENDPDQILEKVLAEPKYAIMPGNFMETDDYVYFHFTFEKSLIARYNKKTDQTELYKTLHIPGLGAKIQNLQLQSGQTWIGVLQPAAIVWDSDAAQAASGLDEMDNPVLVLCELP